MKTPNPVRLRSLRHPALLALGLAIATAAPAATKKEPVNRGLEPTNQPVVQRTDYVFDAVPDGYNGLSPAERRRLTEWFDAIDLGYGDRIGIADPSAYGRSNIASVVSDLVGGYGLLLADGAPRTAGDAPAGAIRIVVSRTTASVPSCPNWGNKAEGDLQGGVSYDYGCATNGNLAAMIANPEDLVQGRRTNSELRGVTASRAIKAYRDAAPTGNGNTLK